MSDKEEKNPNKRERRLARKLLVAEEAAKIAEEAAKAEEILKQKEASSYPESVNVWRRTLSI